MKNIMLGAIGGIVIIYMVLIQLSAYAGNIRANELENCVSDACMQTLKKHYGGSDGEAGADVESRIRERISSDSEITVSITGCDMEKGLLSVVVSETFSYPNGTQRTFTAEKTAIMEKKADESGYITVLYRNNGMDYKEYELLPGEVLPLPKLPDHAKGWKVGGESSLLEPGRQSGGTDLIIEAVY